MAGLTSRKAGLTSWKAGLTSWTAGLAGLTSWKAGLISWKAGLISWKAGLTSWKAGLTVSTKTPSSSSSSTLGYEPSTIGALVCDEVDDSISLLYTGESDGSCLWNNVDCSEVELRVERIDCSNESCGSEFNFLYEND